MDFDKHKKEALVKKDKSREGKIDEPILELVNKINSCKDYYTTSSCSGRIVLISSTGNEKKGSFWLFKSHDVVDAKDVIKALKSGFKGDVSFRFEGAILHVACRTIECAQKLVNAARGAGFKRTGIQSTNNKIVAEISSSEIIGAPIAKEGILAVDDGYITFLTAAANEKLNKNKNKIKKLSSSSFSA